MFVTPKPTDESVSIISSKLDDEEAEDLVKKCVHALIVLGQDRNPIKKMELNRLVFTTVHYRIVNAIIEISNKKLIEIFGMRLFELPDKSQYILVNSSPQFAENLKYDDSNCESLAALYIILMDIFVSPDDRLPMDEITKTFDVLDMDEETLKAHLEYFVRKLYLTKVRGPENVFFSWGPRSFAEVEPDAFLQRFIDMAGGGNIDDWPEQKRRIEKLKSLGNRTTNMIT